MGRRSDGALRPNRGALCRTYRVGLRRLQRRARALALVVAGAAGVDLNDDGVVNATDLSIMLANWG